MELKAHIYTIVITLNPYKHTNIFEEKNKYTGTQISKNTEHTKTQDRSCGITFKTYTT